MDNTAWAVVVAAGQGSRMGKGPKKQFRLLAGLPVLGHTLQAFEDSTVIKGVTLVVAPDEVEWCRVEIVERYGYTKVAEVVPGGAERQESVWNGLLRVPEIPFVVIHDGVRPFITPRHIAQVVEGAKDYGAATLAVPPKDTIKIVDEDRGTTKNLPRDKLWLVQTPQAFRRDTIVEAHYKARVDGFTGTDDTSLVEHAGGRVRVVTGDYANIKITTPEDFAFAEVLLGGRAVVRTGFGYDVHRLVEGRRLVLGGVTIPHRRGLQGHSDADVLTHAVMDALLGAAGAGDIGHHFPDSDPSYRDISSLKLLAAVNDLILERSLEIGNLDITVVAQEPRLAPYIPEMRSNLARVLGIGEEVINIKATTTEGLGFTGKGEGIAAYAIASLRVVVSPHGRVL
ncbi:MAG: 2-C-methyl-D-erythritol 4-phosphate cytidylyltransferase [Peptococcaceae bacterium]|nr:2-C-methyl-D-erythritol 4-phosphate cytidylyltransferase [Peptococcaceae bacterium]